MDNETRDMFNLILSEITGMKSEITGMKCNIDKIDIRLDRMESDINVLKDGQIIMQKDINEIKNSILDNNQAIGKAIITASETLERNISTKIDDINYATATNSYDIAVLRNKKQA